MFIDVMFVTLVALAAYPYVGYPILLYLLTRRHPDPLPPADGTTPSVTIIVSAYNESEVIADKVNNLQEIDYPRERLKVVIGSDGSSDGTVSIARAAVRDEFPIEILDLQPRRGKAAILGELVAQTDSEVVVLSDANTYFEPKAVARLARWFADPSVGCVCGLMDLVPLPGGSQAEQRYWRFETWLKKLENRVGAVLGANGGIYAFRHAAYEPLQEDAITDDFLLPMLIRMRGHRIIFDPTAVAQEETAPTILHEYTRRARIGAGNVQALRLTRSLLGLRAGWTAFAYWSHKVARWAAPLCFTAAMILAFAQLHRPLYAGAAAAAVVAAALAASGWLLERIGWRAGTLVTLPYAFVAMNAALLVGAARFLRGHQDPRWARTPRSARRPK
jgi:cellulose synthase/poly-beta-1,6-N-acetylglucosamine synthase-like glycosyltransferase